MRARSRFWHRTALLTLVAAAGVLASAANGESAGEESWYARKLAAGDTPLRVEHFWSKGRRLRTETVVAGRPVVTIVNEAHYYVIDALAGTGLAVKRSPAARAADKRGGRPFGNYAARLIDQGAERVRTERIHGRLCDVYRLTDVRGRQEIWLTQDSFRLPVRVEAYDRTTKFTVRSDYLDWSRNLPIPDAFFEPDPRLRMERLDYSEYLERSAKEAVGPAPILHADLLHGESPRRER